jgi:small-conductance mechanosensitive channel
MNVPGFDLSQVAVNDVAHAMQLALGPVFLLNGVGVMLAMLTTRLSRIVDRARTVEERLPQSQGGELAEIRRVLAVTRRRARLMNRAITLGTVAALLVALIVALLFLAAFLTFPIGHTIAVLFVTCMGALIGSLWCFLVEVRVATAALRIGTYKLREEETA